jgi:primosomal protein N'
MAETDLFSSVREAPISQREIARPFALVVAGEELLRRSAELGLDRLLHKIAGENKPARLGAIPLGATPGQARGPAQPPAFAGSQTPDEIDAALLKSGLAGQFPIRVSAEAVARRPPAPDLFIETARRLGVEPWRCIVVSAAADLLRAARRAACQALAVAGPSAPCPPARIAQAGARAGDGGKEAPAPSCEADISAIADHTVESLHGLSRTRLESLFFSRAKTLYADVAVALPVRHTYTYRVPAGLREFVRVGAMVRVPVRGRAASGVIARLSLFTRAPKKRLKSIDKILTPEYAIPPDLMALGEWISEYYLSGPGETLGAIAFFGLSDEKPRTERQLILSESLNEGLNLDQGFLPVRRAGRDAGRCAQEGGAGPSESPKTLALTQRQSEVVRFFVDNLNEPITRAELMRRVRCSTGRPCSAGVIDALIRKGALREQTESVERGDGYGAVERRDGYGEAPGAPSAAARAPEWQPLEESSGAAAPGCEILSGQRPAGQGRPAEQGLPAEQERPPEQGPPAEAPHVLTPEQDKAFARIRGAMDAGRFETFLLYGITGSGKTEIYLQAVARVLAEERQAIVLAPEISLTPQAVARFRARFGSRVGVYHSQLSRGQKYDLWRRIASGRVQVLVGARSAVFAPFANLGLVVVDEEHEHSYKQSDPAPRYHARDVAIWRARFAGVPAILGSATPSLESFFNAQQGRFTLLELTRRVGEAVLPDVRLIDMGALVREERQTRLISDPLVEAIARRLEAKEQVILFLNRRGFSSFLLCMACRTVVRCGHCDVVMTWHKSVRRVICHFCGDEQPRPSHCPECGEPAPSPIGAGTERIEEEVRRLFPQARVLRIDLDTTRGKHGFLRMWDAIEGGGADILLGTQMIAKGLHLERVTLVGVISVDHTLFLPDFRAAERAFAQLTQVAGRAGRMARRGEVIVQTFVPHHYAIQRAVAHDCEGFWRQELHIREMLRFPPHQRLLRVLASSLKADRVEVRARRLGQLLRERTARVNDYRSLTVLGPVPAPIERLQDRTRWQIVLRGSSPALMRRLLFDALAVYEREKGRTGVSLKLDMDPLDLL